jgi:hypothetical protein
MEDSSGWAEVSSVMSSHQTGRREMTRKTANTETDRMIDNLMASAGHEPMPTRFSATLDRPQALVRIKDVETGREVETAVIDYREIRRVLNELFS